MKVRVRTPASTSNLGPGFDVLGLALEIVNEVTAVPVEGDAITIDPGADGDDALRNPAQNLIAVAYGITCDRLGVSAPLRGVSLTCRNAIPLTRGLGSSAAAALSGVLVADAIHHGRLNHTEILEIVTAIEGHPENGAAALLGGLVICASDAPPVRADVHDDLLAVLYIPDLELSTREAREVVPTSFSRADAVHNLGRCALLVHALEQRDYDVLRIAMEDRWHQPHRRALFPALPQLIDAAQAAGARGAALSGAGPTVIALTDGDADAIAHSMRAMAHVAGVRGRTMTCALRAKGAVVERL